MKSSLLQVLGAALIMAALFKGCGLPPEAEKFKSCTEQAFDVKTGKKTFVCETTDGTKYLITAEKINK